jgi:2-deoxy-D-gluconate 3-dehydrogenase
MGILNGKTAVITGASRGIGKAIAICFAEEGADIVTITRKKPVETIAEVTALGARCVSAEYDLSDGDGLDAMVDGIIRECGTVDILCNNAGAQIRHSCAEFPRSDWDYVMNVNCNNVFFLCQKIGRIMLEKSYGKIINIASMLSFQGGLTVPAYAASKGALMQFTKSLSNEWSSLGVNVNCIAPGYCDTELNTALIADPARSKQILDRIPAGRWGRPVDIAGAALFLASGASDYVNGVVIPVDGGWLGR